MLMDRTGQPSRFALSAAFTLIALASLGIATYAYAVCSSNTAYSVTSSAPPPIGNWTDTTGAVWSPAGGFPGCSTGDSAADTNVSPTTLIINSAIPNPIAGLNESCNGCTIDIQSGGSLTLAGTGSIAASTTIVVEPGGTLTLASGANLTVASGASLSVNGGYVDVQTGATLILNGNSTVTNGGTLATSGGTWTVNSTFTIQSNGTVALAGGTVNGSGTINNNGTLSQNGANTAVSATFNNNSSGNVHVYAGTLSLSAGTGDSTFTIDAGGTLDFPSGSYTTTANGVISGGGTLQVSGGTLTIGGVTSPANLTMNAGTLTGGGFLSVAGTWNWNGGTLTGSGGRELAGTGTANITGSVSAPTVDGTTLNLYGGTSLTAGVNFFTLQNSATLTNYGNFAINTDGSLAGSFTETFDNAPNGLISKNSGAGTFTISPTFNNSANVYSVSGTLALGNGNDPGGSYYASSGCTLAFAGNRSNASYVSADGTISFPSGTTQFTGTYGVNGTTSISGGAMSINSSTNAYTNNLAFTAGTLSVSTDFTMNGTGTWSGGTINGSSFFHVGPGATMTIDCANNLAVISQATYVDDSGGTTNYTAASPNYLKLIGGALTNHGTFDIQTDQPIVGATFVATSAPKQASKRSLLIGAPPVITNDGTWKKSAGTGTTSIDPDFTNSGTVLAQSGTMDFTSTYTQSGGTTTLGAGNITVATAMQLNGGTLNGSGTITGDVQNNATVAPGDATTTIGDIEITGNYTQASAASLNIKIAGVGNYDELNATGADTLDGTLNVSLINGFVPANGDMFPIMAFASRTGDFAVKNLPAFDGTHGSWAANYTPTALDLTAIVSPSQSDLSASMSGPANVNAASPLSYTIDITNNGGDPTSGTTTVVDTLPAGVSAASGAGSGWSCGAPSGGTITCTSTSAVAISTNFPTLTISMTAPSTGGSITNSATVSNANDPNGANNTASASTTVVAQANLSITKNGPTGVTAGQNVTYTIAVSNIGPSDASNVVVSDPTPANLTFVGNSGACTSAFPCNIGTLTSGASATINATYSTSPGFTGNVTNSATVSSTTNDPDNSNNSASATTNVGAQADVAIAKSGPATAVPGQNVTYTVTVTNNGPSSATSVVVTDPTPTGLTFVSNSGACTSPYPCSLGTVNVGSPATITTTYSVPANYPGLGIINTASVSSAVNDPNTSNNSATAITTISTQTDLSIAKSGPPSANVGTNVTYTVVVTNNGTLAANNVFVSDPTPAGLTFVSNSGACTTSYPCGLGTIGAGQSATITSIYSVPQTYAGTTISNTASVSSSTPDGNPSNNSATAVTPVSTARVADLAITKTGPETGQANPGTNVTFHIAVTNAGPNDATNVVINDPTPSGLTFVSNSGACTTPFPCVIASLGAGQALQMNATYTVNSSARASVVNTASVTSSATDPNTSNNSSSVAVRTSPLPACPTASPQLLTPAAGATQLSPVTFSWTAVPHATSYVLSIVGASGMSSMTTTSTSATADLAGGSYSWFVIAQGASNCPATGSATSSFNVCTTPAAPLASVVGEATTGQSYAVQWNIVDGTVSYELQEAGDAAFTNPTTFSITDGTSKSFTKTSDVATAFFYRVRAVSACGGTGPYSDTIRVVIVPLPSQNTPGGPSFNAPLGSTQPITFPLFVKGAPGSTTSFIATADKPWITILPTSGLLPPEGVTLMITVDPTGLTNGTWTGTVMIVTGSTAITGRLAPNGSSVSSTPVSVSIVTPVSPGKLTTPSANAQIIPSVGHLAGASEWRSDVRIANPGTSSMSLQVTFNDGTSIKQTTITVDAGTTVALDDVARNWFGVGSLGDSANGTLTIDPGAGRRVVGADDVSKTTASVVTSRTYNASANGTLGQFIPAVPFLNFLSAAGGSSLILQQIAQSAAFHTNLGLVEASGKPATVVVSTFDASGNSLFSVPVSLNGGEQKQINSFLAQNNVSLDSGHIEVKPAGGDGKVTAYASIVDNKSNDPFLVSGVPLTAGTTRYIVPGIADLSGGGNNWRSDVRIFNGSNAPATATLTFYPNANPSAAVSKDVTINPSEMKPLDGVLASTFGVTNAGGTLHVTTAVPTPLVVSARTYDQTGNGTLGQFIAATTLADAVGNGDRALQLVQLEDSPRYRTNLGIAEVSGQPATVEISVFLPGSKASPKATIALGAYDSRQLPILSALGLGNAYNARVAVRVIDGSGKVTAYGSVIDQTTQAPVYVPAQ